MRDPVRLVGSELQKPLPNSWLDLVFSSKSAKSGGVVRRNVRWVEREIGREMLIAEVRSRRFHMIETGGQFIIICNRGGLSMVC